MSKIIGKLVMTFTADITKRDMTNKYHPLLTKNASLNLSNLDGENVSLQVEDFSVTHLEELD